MKIKDVLKIKELIPMLFNLDMEKVYDVEIKEHKERRSLNANAYAWALMAKLGNALRESKEEIYIKMLERYGQFELVSIQSYIDVTGYLKYFKEVGKSKLNGKEFTHYRIFKGSSEFDTREMSIFIDGIVSECQDLGIETMTPNELEKLKAMWGV